MLKAVRHAFMAGAPRSHLLRSNSRQMAHLTYKWHTSHINGANGAYVRVCIILLLSSFPLFFLPVSLFGLSFSRLFLVLVADIFVHR